MTQQESTSLVVTNQSKPALPSMFDLSPKNKVAFASEIATVLSDVIEKQKLAVSISGRKYIKAEGWATLGTLLNVLPKEDRVVELSDGSYEAWVNLVSTNTGLVVGGASALCGVDEKRWRDADRYARRSMAITRATGKAYRLAFAFIPAMAGYATTPYEEMPPEEARDHSKTVVKGASKTQPIIDAEEEAYTATEPQKRQLMKIATELGITETTSLKELNKHCMGKPFATLKDTIQTYVQIPFGE